MRDVTLRLPLRCGGKRIDGTCRRPTRGTAVSTSNQPPSYPDEGGQPSYPASGGAEPPPSYPASPSGGQTSYPAPEAGGQPSHPGPGGYGGAPPQQTSNVLSIIAIVFGVIAVVFFPIVFGPLGIICGGIALSRKERLAKIGLGVAIAGMIAGFILAAVVFSQLN